MININIFSDFACPWCYIGEKRLEKAISRLGLAGDVNICYRAFELDPNAPKEAKLTSAERIAAKYNLPLEKAQKKVAQIDNVAREDGLDFNYSGAKPCNTFDAHRLVKLAEHSYDNATVNKVVQALFDAYFTRNLVISDPKVLEEVGTSAGIDLSDIKDMLESDQYNEDVINDENEARNLGVTGVPFIILDGKMAIPGAVSTEDFMDALSHINESVKLNEKGDTCAAGCDEGGCRI
ncbi:MAG: DsbA family oxidoreductase [Muribaculaceae bacterium]|nr:DsbA family oxidoreductase [Muribaculaceae bacterium]